MPIKRNVAVGAMFLLGILWIRVWSGRLANVLMQPRVIAAGVAKLLVFNRFNYSMAFVPIPN